MPSPLLAHNTLQLNALQRANADLIISIFGARGYTPQVAMAAVANAYGESALGLYMTGDNGHSVGLFQLSDRGGGKGMTVAQRMDPVANTNRIIEEMVAAEKTRGPVVTGAATALQATRAFTIYVERPANAQADATKREGFARKLFGPFAEMEGNSPSMPSIAGWWWVKLATSAAVLAALAWRFGPQIARMVG